MGGIALAITAEPQSTRAWERGSIGEQKLADALAGLDYVTVLHDRRVRGTRGNIDHIVINSTLVCSGVSLCTSLRASQPTIRCAMLWGNLCNGS
jgi:hypothetical protein